MASTWAAVFVGMFFFEAASGHSSSPSSSAWEHFIPFKVKNTSDAKSWRDAFMHTYVDKYLPHLKNESDAKEWRDAFMKKYGDPAMRHVKNASDANSWRKAFLKEYVSTSLPKIKNMNDAEEWKKGFLEEYAPSVNNWRDDFIDTYAKKYLSQPEPATSTQPTLLLASSDTTSPSDWERFLPFKVKNTSDAKSWRDAFMHTYVDTYFPHVKNMSDVKEWRDAFMKAYGDHAMGRVKNMSDANSWRKAFMKEYVTRYLPHVKNMSDAKEWERAFLSKYAPSTGDWRKTFMDKYAGQYLKTSASGAANSPVDRKIRSNFLAAAHGKRPMAASASVPAPLGAPLLVELILAGAGPPTLVLLTCWLVLSGRLEHNLRRGPAKESEEPDFGYMRV